MPIVIVDPELEERLARLGKAQPVPSNKTAMARAILTEHTRDLRRPLAWRAAQVTSDQDAAEHGSDNQHQGSDAG